jgi:hypothetical protein
MRSTTIANTLAILLLAWGTGALGQEVAAAASTLTIRVVARDEDQLIEKINRTHAEMAAKGFKFAAISIRIDDAVVTYTRD